MSTVHQRKISLVPITVVWVKSLVQCNSMTATMAMVRMRSTGMFSLASLGGMFNLARCTFPEMWCFVELYLAEKRLTQGFFRVCFCFMLWIFRADSRGVIHF